MDEIVFLSRYLMIHSLLLAVGALALSLNALARARPGLPRAGERLKIQYAMLGLVLVLPFLTLAMQRTGWVTPPARIWAAAAMNSAEIDAGGATSMPMVTAFSDELYMVRSGGMDCRVFVALPGFGHSAPGHRHGARNCQKKVHTGGFLHDSAHRDGPNLSDGPPQRALCPLVSRFGARRAAREPAGAAGPFPHCAAPRNSASPSG